MGTPQTLLAVANFSLMACVDLEEYGNEYESTILG